MNGAYHHLTPPQVGLAALLVLVNAALSLALRLGLGRRLLVAAVRLVVQLLLVGLVLQWVFANARWYTVVALAALMTVIAGVAAVRRTERRYPGVWLDSLLSVWLASWLVMGFALTAVVPVEPWYRPQYAVPLLGMVLGNALNGISLGLDSFGHELAARRGQVEALLALGATRWEAAREPVQRAVRTGMVPVLNAMAVAGIVSLPGMMTGQVLGGVDPVEAAKYQIVIMFLIAAASALATVGAVLLGYRRLFNADDQFLYGRLSARG
jgi:putative ABC transport system permease protein